MEGALQLPVIDLSSTDEPLFTDSLRKACIENGCFYLINHDVEDDLIQRVFDGSREFFALSVGEKMKVLRKNHRGYTPFYDEKLDLVDNLKGDPKESIYFGAPEDISPYGNLDQWPPEDFPMLEIYNGRILQSYSVCRDKLQKPQIWEDVPQLNGMMHHSTGFHCYCWRYDGKVNKLSIYHRVTKPEQERYSVAMFFDPSPDCVVECMKSCCSESYPPRFSPLLRLKPGSIGNSLATSPETEIREICATKLSPEEEMRTG
ncbi:hypothetical protein P3S68_000473 [Capsicum galapagoense]